MLMQAVSQLENIVKKNMLGEKVLVAPTYSAGRQLLESCTKRGLNLLNLRISTLLGLAEQICQRELLKSKRSIVPATVANELLIGILKRLAANGTPAYFSSLEITPGVSRVIYQAILDLKMAAMIVGEISPSKFINLAKGEDIITIWTEYERELTSRKYLDQADLFRLAAGQNIPTSPRTYIVPSNLKLSLLERNFLRVLTKDKFEVIDFGRPKGLIPPQNSLERELTTIELGSDSPFSRLLWLNDIANAPAAQELGVEMFRSYGESNELRAVLARIKKRAIPFEQAAIYYSTQEPYAHLCYALAQELQIPMTFGQGITIRCTNPGRLFFGLLAWAKGGLKVSDFLPLLINGEFKIPEENAPLKSAIVRFFRTSGIGWGHERYFSVIENELAQLESEPASDKASENDDVNAHKEQRRDNLKWLKNFITGVFASLPEPGAEGCLPYGKLAGWLYDLVDGFASVFNAADGEAKKAICEELQLLKDSFTESLEPEEAYARLEAIIEGKRVNAATPQPGCLHVDHYSAGQWIARPHVFVIGLDANRFPGAVAQDPVLLDVERQNIGHGLPLPGQITREKMYDIIQFLGSVPETLTVSYSAFDTVENRMVFPAAVLLQIHRLLANDETLDYSSLLKSLGERKGFVPKETDEALGEAGWWLNTLSNETRNVELDTFKRIYPALYDGIQAEHKRKEADITPYDGRVEVDRAAVDPTVNDELIMSCSQLETLGKCPFSYFLRYVLKINPLEELTFDPSVWLDAKTKGDLYHLIFERFYQGLLEKGESPELAQHVSYLYEIADEIITEKKALIPPPSDLVFEYERRSIFDSCRIFLKSEEAEVHSGRPKYLELTFGMAGDNGDLGSCDAVPIILPKDKQFLLRGRIDRVDETPEGLKVWDYKSGSAYGYSDREYFQGGRQLQHGLYPLALEWLLEGKGLSAKPKVKESGYIFPTIKGEGKRIVRQQIRRESLYEILEHLFSLLAQGTFVMTDNGDDCNFCDYRDACNRSYRSQEALAKMMTDTFRRLRSHA